MDDDGGGDGVSKGDGSGDQHDHDIWRDLRNSTFEAFGVVFS
jgi:hypothetical protein